MTDKLHLRLNGLATKKGDSAYRQSDNEFAAELLMPELMLKNDVIGKELDVSFLARKYQVSEQALWIQLINLKLTS